MKERERERERERSPGRLAEHRVSVTLQRVPRTRTVSSEMALITIHSPALRSGESGWCRGQTHPSLVAGSTSPGLPEGDALTPHPPPKDLPLGWDPFGERLLNAQQQSDCGASLLIVLIFQLTYFKVNSWSYCLLY